MKKLLDKLKKIYKKFIFITDILFDILISRAMFTEWYSGAIPSILWLLLGSVFLFGAIRKFYKKPPVLFPLFKQLKTILFSFVISFIFLQGWYEGYWGITDWSSGDAMLFLIAGLLFFMTGVTITIRKILKKPSLGELLKQFIARRKS